jgi:signal peptidase I
LKTCKKLITLTAYQNFSLREELNLKYLADTPSEKAGQKSLVREYAEAILIAILLALFIRAFVVQAFKIPSGSMKSTLLVGDHILVNKFIYGVKIPFLNKDLIHISDPKRFDVVVFQYPVDPSKDFIKRVIGLPGDTVQVKDKKVFVNNQELNEPYITHSDNKILPASVSPRDNTGPIVVPPHSIFVMGDNRDESYDSRFWKFVDLNDLKGQAFIIYWSWNQDGDASLESYVRWNRIGKVLH